MAWLAVNYNGEEYIFSNKPYRRDFVTKNSQWICSVNTECVKLPCGAIEKLISKNITWQDEPVEIK